MTPKDKSTGPKAAYAARGARDNRKPGGKPEKRDGKPEARAARPAVSEDAGDVKAERISKLLARAGIASRRDVERMIMEGRVALNGKVLDTPVVNATFADKIEVDGQPIRGVERTRLWLYHKPAGLVTTNSDPEGRPTVFDNLPEELPRVMSIGRLDINTEGLLLLTNDGGLARVLELPTTGWLRRYRVRAHGEVEQADLDRLKDGIAVEGVLYGSIDATLDRKQGHNVWITMGLREGKNREIKNVLGALGLEVNRLIRISYGPFQLGDLDEGKALEVRGRMLREQLGPRLIDDAKANFDAPIYSGGEAEEKAEAKNDRGWARRDKDTDFREEGRARLDTRKAPSGKSDRGDRKPGGKSFGDKKFGDKKFGDRDDRGGFGDRAKKDSAPVTRARSSNVWMAPGARPVSEKSAKAEGAEPRKSTRHEGAPQSKRYGRGKDGQPTRTLSKHDPDRKPRSGASFDEGPRVKVSRARDEEGEWIRAEGKESNDRGGDFGRKRGFGDRNDRGDRGGDRPPRGDRGERTARGERPGEGRGPRAERSFGDRPFGDKPRGGDRGGKSFGEKSYGERSYGDKPRGKPSGGKPGFGKPSSFRADGDRPRGGKPGGKPSGKPGGKPGGFRGPPKGKR